MLITGAASGCAWEPQDDARTFEVPSSDWEEGDLALEALISGTLVIDDSGCTYLEDEDASLRLGIVFPFALGIEEADGTRSIVHSESGKVFAVEGEAVLGYGGGIVDAPDSWPEFCGPAPSEIAFVNDAPQGESLR